MVVIPAYPFRLKKVFKQYVVCCRSYPLQCEHRETARERVCMFFLRLGCSFLSFHLTSLLSFQFLSKRLCLGSTPSLHSCFIVVCSSWFHGWFSRQPTWLDFHAMRGKKADSMDRRSSCTDSRGMCGDTENCSVAGDRADDSLQS